MLLRWLCVTAFVAAAAAASTAAALEDVAAAPDDVAAAAPAMENAILDRGFDESAAGTRGCNG